MRKFALWLIRLYQASPLSSHSACRFTPTCSEYTYQAISKYGILQGSLKGLFRIIKCNPLSKSGSDPLK